MGFLSPLIKIKFYANKIFYFVAGLLIFLAIVLYLEFNLTKKILKENFHNQQSSRSLMKVNLILHNGLVHSLTGVIAHDEEMFFDGMDKVEYSIGYLNSTNILVEIKSYNIPVKINSLSKKLQTLWSSSVEIPPETIKQFYQEIDSIYLVLSKIESKNRHHLAELSSKQASLSKQFGVILTVFSICTILLVFITYYKRRKAEILLQETNVSLEKQVDERTAELKEREYIFKLLALSIDGVDEQEIFNNIAKACVKIFKAEFSIIGRLNDQIDDQTINTCSFIADGELQPSNSYSLPGTPCEKSINKGFCAFSKGVDKQFDKNEILQKHTIEGYIGCSLMDKTGKAIGIVNIFSRQPIQIFEYTKEVMELIALHCANLIERQINEETQVRLTDKLYQAQKMEAIGNLAGGIAHDFNNLLMPILGYSELVLSSPDLDANVKKNIKIILQSSLRAKDLVQQILTIGRKHTQEEFPLKPHLIINEVIKMLRSALPSTIKIVKNIDRNSSLVLADPSRINQLIMNLCVNASHAMESTGGILTIELANREIDSNSECTAISYGSYVCLSITDTGCGIPKKIHEKIFDPYFTTKEESKGTGLGLATVRGIVDSCKGHIFVESELGQGTTFELLFPAVLSKDRMEHKEQSQKSDPDILHIGRIVLVDDDIEVRNLMVAVLSRLGCSVDAFSDPSKALKKIISQPESYDLLMTDQTMPGITGLFLVKQLEKNKITIPVIIVSGQPLLVSKEEMEKLSIKYILNKPVEMNQIKSALENIFD